MSIKHILEASVGDELPCHHENGNRADPFAVMRVTSHCSLFTITRGMCSLWRQRSILNLICRDSIPYQQCSVHTSQCCAALATN